MQSVARRVLGSDTDPTSPQEALPWSRLAHRRRRLPRPERGDPRGRPADCGRGRACVGILEGWHGLVRNLTIPLDVASTDGIVGRGGTILGSSRTNPYKTPTPTCPPSSRTSSALGLDALSPSAATTPWASPTGSTRIIGLPVVGVPKTIDNDLLVTDFTFGFDTAINIVTEAVDRLRTTAESHRRIMVVETMGGNSGWIACFAGIAVAADYILVPEVPIDIAHLVDVLDRRRSAGKSLRDRDRLRRGRVPRQGPSPSMNRLDPFGHPTRRHRPRRVPADRTLTGFETRSVILGHLQRGGPPSAYDRVLATRLGLAASHLVIRKRFGTLVALRKPGSSKNHSTNVSASNTKPSTCDYYDEAAAFFQ